MVRVAEGLTGSPSRLCWPLRRRWPQTISSWCEGLGRAARDRRSRLRARCVCPSRDAHFTPAAPQAPPGRSAPLLAVALVHTHTPISWGLAIPQGRGFPGSPLQLGHRPESEQGLQASQDLSRVCGPRGAASTLRPSRCRGAGTRRALGTAAVCAVASCGPELGTYRGKDRRVRTRPHPVPSLAQLLCRKRSQRCGKHARTRVRNFLFFPFKEPSLSVSPSGPHFAEYLHWDVTDECEVRLVCKVRPGLQRGAVGSPHWAVTGLAGSVRRSWDANPRSVQGAA